MELLATNPNARFGKIWFEAAEQYRAVYDSQPPADFEAKVRSVVQYERGKKEKQLNIRTYQEAAQFAEVQCYRNFSPGELKSSQTRIVVLTPADQIDAGTHKSGEKRFHLTYSSVGLLEFAKLRVRCGMGKGIFPNLFLPIIVLCELLLACLFIINNTCRISRPGAC